MIAGVDEDSSTLSYSYSDKFSEFGSWTPGNKEAGDYTIDITISDDLSSTTQDVNIEVLNNPELRILLDHEADHFIEVSFLEDFTNSLDASNANTKLEFGVNENVTGSIDFITFAEDPEANIENKFLQRFVDIVAGDEIKDEVNSIEITTKYNQIEFANIDESTIKVYVWNEDQIEWIEHTAIVDPSTLSVSFDLDEFGLFALTGDKLIDTSNPSVVDILPINGSQFNITETILISADVVDNWGLANLESVTAEIEGPNNESEGFNLNFNEGIFSGDYSLPELNGTYIITIIAQDKEGNINNTESVNINVVPIIYPPRNGTKLFEDINLNANDDFIFYATNAEMILKGSVDEKIEGGELEIIYSEFNPHEEVLSQVSINRFFEINMDDKLSGKLVDVNTTIFYSDDDVENVNESTLRVYEWNENFQRWLLVYDLGLNGFDKFYRFSNSNPDDNSVSLFESAFGPGSYGIFGEKVLGDGIKIEDNETPSVTIISPQNGSPFNTSELIEIKAIVTDNTWVDSFIVNITLPNQTVDQVTLTLDTQTKSNYSIGYTIPNLDGTYVIRFIAEDSFSNINSSETAEIIVSNSSEEKIFVDRRTLNHTKNRFNDIVISKGNKTKFNASNSSTILELNLSNDITGGEIEILHFDENPTDESGLESNLKGLNHYIEINASDEINDNLDFVTITVMYDDSDLADLDESSIGIYLWDETNFIWEKQNNSWVDVENNLVSVNTTHFSLYGLFGEETVVEDSDPSRNPGSSGSSRTVTITTTTTTLEEDFEEQSNNLNENNTDNNPDPVDLQTNRGDNGIQGITGAAVGGGLVTLKNMGILIIAILIGVIVFRKRK